MTRARTLSKLGSSPAELSQGAVIAGITTIDASGLNITGVITATTLKGDGSGLTGVANTGHIYSTNISVSGITTLTGGTIVAGITTIDASGVNVTGVVTATSFSGDGSELSGVVSGIEVKSSGTSVGTSLTALNFSGATITTGSAGITTITISAAGISTSAYAVPTAGLTTYLKLSDAQEHKLTASGITTVTCYGGTEGESHTLRIVNSGVSTVGFSTYFLWPSGAPPSLTISDGAINLVSFTVQRVGTAGTQLLAGVSLDFS